MGFLQSLFDTNERDIKRYRKVVEKVNALEPQFEKLSDEELRAKTDEFRERLQKSVAAAGGEELEEREKNAPKHTREAKVLREAIDRALDELLPEAFAACREASRRTLHMRHFDVQLIGGMVQHDGRIAELRTGEGKTLMCTLGTYLNAIAGRGVHVVTANDYLVKRDAVWMGPLYHALGMTVGILQGHSPETGEGGGTFIYDPTYEDPTVDGLDARFKYARQTHNRQDAYNCDITYGTSSEFGFDYLRDNMAPSLDYIVQVRGHHFAIVDECDSNLIDEARTPLIISGPAEKSSDLYYVFTKIIPGLERGEQKKDKYDTETDEKDFTVDEKAKSATFTEIGLEKVEAALRRMGYQVEDISSYENLDYMQHAVAALKAHAVFVKDRDYVVKVNQEGKPEVIIVDEFTGRLMFGRRWSDGLHQAVEAKEGIVIENEQQTLATITIQNYFRLYRKLSGMTGTAKTEEDEFRKIYALDVVQVPTNKPMIRKDVADIIYKTEEAKLRGIATEILQLWCKGQPVLVGTRSIEMSERVSSRLTFQALELLGAVHLIRNKMYADQKSLGDKYNQYSQILNARLDDLTMAKLAPLAKDLGVSLKLVDKEKAALQALASALNIPADQEERLHEALMHGIPHNILNAKYHEQEARIIAEAGRKGAITIATNMAGRGVDILLGGTHYKENADTEAMQDFSYRRGGKRHTIAHVVGKNDEAADPDTLGPAGAGTISLTEEEAAAAPDYVKERAEVMALGGLYILGTERHESRRIDNQLRGRAGRQGDPGVSKFHVSLEDYLWRVFGDRSNSILMRQWEEDQAVDTPMLSKMIERAQKKVEQHNFDGRKHVLEYDDVMNVQREVIYRERRKILEGAELRDTLLNYLHDAVDDALALYCPENISPDEWDRSGLFEKLSQQFPLAEYVSEDELDGLTRVQLGDRLHEAAEQAYETREQQFAEETGGGDNSVMRDIERQITIREIDKSWVHHLADMEYLREGIGLRGYAQVDPLVAYKKEALELFERMQGSIQSNVVRDLFTVQVQFQAPGAMDMDLFQLMQQMGISSLDQLPEGFSFEGDGEEGVDPIAAALAAASSSSVPMGAPIPQPGIADVGQNALLAAVADSAQKSQESVPKVGPNDPCPCGSGKKYKNCHRNK
jgi:preprotein translocase subunit SecA